MTEPKAINLTDKFSQFADRRKRWISARYKGNEAHVMTMDRAGEPNIGVNPSARTRETLVVIG